MESLRLDERYEYNETRYYAIMGSHWWTVWDEVLQEDVSYHDTELDAIVDAMSLNGYSDEAIERRLREAGR